MDGVGTRCTPPGVACKCSSPQTCEFGSSDAAVLAPSFPRSARRIAYNWCSQFPQFSPLSNVSSISSISTTISTTISSTISSTISPIDRSIDDGRNCNCTGRALSSSVAFARSAIVRCVRCLLFVVRRSSFVVCCLCCWLSSSSSSSSFVGCCCRLLVGCYVVAVLFCCRSLLLWGSFLARFVYRRSGRRLCGRLACWWRGHGRNCLRRCCELSTLSPASLCPLCRRGFPCGIVVLTTWVTFFSFVDTRVTTA